MSRRNWVPATIGGSVFALFAAYVDTDSTGLTDVFRLQNVPTLLLAARRRRSPHV